MLIEVLPVLLVSNEHTSCNLAVCDSSMVLLNSRIDSSNPVVVSLYIDDDGFIVSFSPGLSL